MFGFHSRKSPAPVERHRLVGVDLSATRVRAVAVGNGQIRPLLLDDPNEDLPLVVTLDRRTPDLGHAGLAICRKTPHSVCGNFLSLLGTPNEWRGEWHSFTPESALTLCLEKARRPITAETDAVGVVLPVYLSVQQVRTVLERTVAARLPVRGSAASPLAVVAHRAASIGVGPRGLDSTVLVIDVDDHALTATLLAIGTQEVRLLSTSSTPKASLRLWKDRLIDGLSDRCVRLCRRDPRDSADAEQDLFLQLDDALERAKAGLTNTLTIRAAHWYQDLTIGSGDLEAICAPVNRVAIEGLKQFLLSAALTAPPRAVWLSRTAGRLPGLAAKIYKHSPEQTQVSVLPANAGAEAAAALLPRWLQGNLPRTHLDAVIPHARPLATGPAIPTASIGTSRRPALPTKMD
jgi:hypothetical protein